VLNVIAIDLQLYKIFKITRVSVFWDTVYMQHGMIVLLVLKKSPDPLLQRICLSLNSVVV